MGDSLEIAIDGFDEAPTPSPSKSPSKDRASKSEEGRPSSAPEKTGDANEPEARKIKGVPAEDIVNDPHYDDFYNNYTGPEKLPPPGSKAGDTQNN